MLTTHSRHMPLNHTSSRKSNQQFTAIFFPCSVNFETSLIRETNDFEHEMNTEKNGGICFELKGSSCPIVSENLSFALRIYFY